MDKTQKYYKLHVKHDICELYKKGKYNDVIKLASKYLEFLPSDQMVRFMSAKSYRKLHKFDMAIEDLKYGLKREYNEHYLTELYFLYYYLNKYEEAIDLLPHLYGSRVINPYSVVISELVMKKQLGIDIRTKKGDKCDYIKSQIIDYNPDKALKHIQEHFITTSEDKTKSYFNNNIDLDYLFKIIKTNIDNKKKVNTDEILEVHYFSISNIGNFKNNVCNFLKVVVIPNTNDIITMYPTCEVDYDYITEINIDYSKLLKREHSKVKRMSQIDKFNARYNKRV